MSSPFDYSLPPDVCLLLRADAERCWLRREVMPVLRHLETREQLSDDRAEAALAYLEVIWSEATARARETDAAHEQLACEDADHDRLSGRANRYHTAVRVLRDVVAARVRPFVDSPIEIYHDGHDGVEGMPWATDAVRPPSNGRARGAA